MEMIDLSRDLFHRTQTHPAHPPVIISVWYDHAEKKRAGNTSFSSKALSIAFSDHAGTHVDAPVHFNSVPMPFQSTRCRWRNSIRPASVLICPTYRCAMPWHPEMEAALAASGQEIRADDTVLLHMATNDRLLGKPGRRFPRPRGGKRALAGRPGHRHVWCGGGEPSPRRRTQLPGPSRMWRTGDHTDGECLANLDKLVGRGRFRFIGFPLKIRGGTASPIRAVAIFE